jgi:hypothetical protein
MTHRFLPVAGLIAAVLVSGCGDVTAPAPGTAAATVRVTVPASARQGDVVELGLDARDAGNVALPDSLVDWRVEPAAGGFVHDRRFVGYQAGPLRIIASSGSVADTAELVVEPRGVTAVTFEPVGTGEVRDRFTSDLWVHGGFAYTGTWGSRDAMGDALNVWDVRDPAAPILTRTLLVEARTVNDVKVSADGRLAVITHEHSRDELNGITILDLADPGAPTVVTRYTHGLQTGVHNVWIEDDYVYAAANGVSQGLRIIDISEPARPVEAARFWAGESFLHDVYVRDGLAFLSHWGAGLVILDVGHGIAGGSPTAPVEVSRIQIGGHTHNAWYWPDAGYVFVGEENFVLPGRMHVIDVDDLRRPREVATFTVPVHSPPHNFWLDEDRGILYAAWYEAGIRAIDVTGTLLGQLELQGRERGASVYAGFAEGGCRTLPVTCSWAPQLEGGLVYVADKNHGLWILRPAMD